MTVNIIKLAVGVDSFAELDKRQKQLFKETKQLMHITRQTPKRSDEVLNNGSLYWVIKGFISARQKLIELRPVELDGVQHCGFVLERKLILVEPRPRGPFQGWRYFDVKDAPPDLVMHDVNMPDEMLRKLAELGLI